MSNEDYKPNLDGMVSPEQVDAAEKRMTEPAKPSLFDNLNPKNWSDKTKGKLKMVAAAAIGAGLMKVGLSAGVVAELVQLLFGG